MIYEPTPREALMALAALSMAALIAAFIAQYVFGLEPCILCLWQRVPYAIAVFAGMAGLYFSPRPFLWVMALLFAAGAATAFFHVGVEQLWWEGTNACTHQFDPDNLEALREQILKPKPRCDEVAWSLFGISMAGYNVMMSAAMAAAAVYFARRL